MNDGFLEWWDSVEAWIVGQSLYMQILLGAVVLVPLAIGLAWVLNFLVEKIFAVARRRGDGDDHGMGI